jgi:signal peptidase I
MEFVPPAVSDLPVEPHLSQALVSLVQEGLGERGRLWLRLQGDSMWPTIPAGSLVEVEQVKTPAVRCGDMVVWQQEGSLIAHRVVQRVRAGSGVLLLTKGDNCASADRLMSQEAIVGRISQVKREDGTALVRSSVGYRFEAAFWISRWHARRILGRVTRRLPVKARIVLARARNSLGRTLSRSFEILYLRR